MSKVKVHRAQPSLDMTPMVDLAFLLVTFFMLTTKFSSDDPVVIDMPTSVAEIKLPETDILTISISKEGQVLFNMDGKYNRVELLQKMGERYGVAFTEEEKNAFALVPSFGVPMGSLKQFLQLKPEDRKSLEQPGIPVDSLNNELTDWVVFSRVTNSKLRIAIKGDRDAPYPIVRKVINTLQNNKISRFNLITNMEKAS